MDKAYVMSSDSLDETPWRELDTVRGVKIRLIRGDDLGRAGILRFDPGAGHPGIFYQDAQCFVLVLEGSITIANEHLAAGSYVYVPPNVDPGITQAGVDGSTIFFHLVGDLRDLFHINEGHGHGGFARKDTLVSATPDA